MAYNTVKIKKYSDVIEEFTAAAALSPGMLVELTPAATTIRKHATAGGNAIPMFALEDELQGKGITDDYAAGDQVQVWVAGRGDIVYARILDEEHIEIGDFLESGGGGFLRECQPPHGDSSTDIVSMPIVAQALEHLDLSGLAGSESSAAPQRMFIKVRVV
jgi:hypothetical protein